MCLVAVLVAVCCDRWAESVALAYVGIRRQRDGHLHSCCIIWSWRYVEDPWSQEGNTLETAGRERPVHLCHFLTEGAWDLIGLERREGF